MGKSFKLVHEKDGVKEDWFLSNDIGYLEDVIYFNASNMVEGETLTLKQNL